LILPVFVSPIVNGLLFVVAMVFPLALLLLNVKLPAIDAVGIPEPMLLMNANLALLLDVPPKRRSSVILNGASAPRFSCNNCESTTPLLVMVPVQFRFPVALNTVHPVDVYPPAIFTSPVPDPAIFTPPVDVPAILTVPLVPASRLILVAAVETEIVGAVEVKVSAVLLVLIVSKEETPVSAPLLIFTPLIVLLVAAVIPPLKVSAPVLLTVNLVVPDAEAVIKSPLLVLFTIKDALLPMPPLTERTAGVLVLLPT